MLAYECAILHLRAEQVAGVEGQAQRGGVGAERIVRLDRARHQFGFLRPHPLVDMLPVPAIGPAVESAVPDRGHVIGNEIGPEFVALVDGNP
ncbi:hypothetical protein D9M68_378570 [compost metagenome]